MVVIASPSTSQSAVASILSKLLNQPIHEQQVNPLAAYLGALSAVLIGVSYADSQVVEAEKQRLNKILTQFIPVDNSLNSVVRTLLQGVRDSKMYAKPTELATLMSLFSESEKLLLITLGYEMATADGDLNFKEQNYLHIIAQHLQLKDEWIVALEAGLVRQQMSDTLSEVRYLIDPARFQSLDPIFAKAASQMLMQLPENSKSHGISKQVAYEALASFQARRQQLKLFCSELEQIVSECHEQTLSSQPLTADLQKIYQKLTSQKFRVAVVGEFSQGKSTFLNALLGKEIQPTRVIPCSGGITVLRYGEQKQVICRYLSGQEEIIPLEEYQTRASIPDDIALGNRAEALASDVLELVYEHPDLALCQQGVELIDSPGLNEHPERTRITNQILENVDAVIFLANGSRPMTQGERELLHSLRLKLNGGLAERPANNLFVLMNFMDLLKREQDRQQVRQLVENFVLGEIPIIENHKRLHFISARSALDAIVDGDEQNDYLQTFREFTQILETFLTQERGLVVNQRSQADLNSMMQTLTQQLNQAEEIIVGKVTVLNAARQDILNKIGEASGFLANLRTLIQTASEQKRDQVKRLPFMQLLENAVRQKSTSWISTQGEKNKISKEFFDKFQSDLADAVEQWIQTKILQETLTSTLKIIDSSIQGKIYQLRKSAESLDHETGSRLVTQLDLSIDRVAPQFKFNAVTDSDTWDSAWKIGIGSISGLGGGGLLLGGAAIAVSSVAFIPLVLTGGAVLGIAAAGAALGTAIGGAIGFFTPPDQEEIKQEVLEEGFKQFYAQGGTERLTSSLDNLVKGLFDQRLETIQTVTQQYMALLNSLLIDSEALHTLTSDEATTKSQYYQTQRQKLLTLQAQLDDFSA